MILSIGEILADIFFQPKSGDMTARLGGAPFNLAVSAARSGADVSFLGRVGDDLLGKWLKEESQKYGLKTYIQFDPSHNTTIAMVSVKDGERDFSFLRKNTADYHIEFDPSVISEARPTIIHVGSLMLSEKEGVSLASKIFDIAEKQGIKISFDVNYRADLFGSPDAAKSKLEPFIKRANILKFSEDEIEAFTSLPAIEAIERYKNDVVCVTLGSKGSLARYKGKTVFQPSAKVDPVDTTGAGDAFFGAFLAGVDKTWDSLNEDKIKEILISANAKGAEATTYIGAIRL